jgi:hypothetical protein
MMAMVTLTRVGHVGHQLSSSSAVRRALQMLLFASLNLPLRDGGIACYDLAGVGLVQKV